MAVFIPAPISITTYVFTVYFLFMLIVAHCLFVCNFRRWYRSALLRRQHVMLTALNSPQSIDRLPLICCHQCLIGCIHIDTSTSTCSSTRVIHTNEWSVHGHSYKHKHFSCNSVDVKNLWWKLLVKYHEFLWSKVYSNISGNVIRGCLHQNLHHTFTMCCINK